MRQTIIFSFQWTLKCKLTFEIYSITLYREVLYLCNHVFVYISLGPIITLEQSTKTQYKRFFLFLNGRGNWNKGKIMMRYQQSYRLDQYEETDFWPQHLLEVDDKSRSQCKQRNVMSFKFPIVLKINTLNFTHSGAF